MKKAIFTSLVLVLLVMVGCSRPELTPTDPTNVTQDTNNASQDVTFRRTESSLYTPSGELLINLNWLNDIGKTNASCTLVKTAVTSENSFIAYVIGEEIQVKDFFSEVQELITYYKSASKNEEGASGGFELYGVLWRLEDLKIENLRVEMQQMNYYYVFHFIRE